MLTYNPPPTVLPEPDELFNKAVNFVTETGKASATIFQRFFRIGFARAGSLLDELEQAGVVGPVNGAKPREVLIPHKNENGETIVPKNIKKEVKVDNFEQTLASWRKTKYAEGKTDRFEIELGVDEDKKKVNLDLEKYGSLLAIGSQFTSEVEILNSILATSMAKYSPEELRLIVIDGIQGDIVVPNQASHLLTPAILEPEKAISALKWAVMQIEHRAKSEGQGDKPKILILISSLNQISYFSPSEVEDNLYRILVQGRKYGIYFVIGTDYPNPRTAKEIIANMPTKLIFKPTDKKIARETGVPESYELTSPDQAILETMYEGRRKITVSKVNPKEIYEEIFE